MSEWFPVIMYIDSGADITLIPKEFWCIVRVRSV